MKIEITAEQERQLAKQMLKQLLDGAGGQVVFETAKEALSNQFDIHAQWALQMNAFDSVERYIEETFKSQIESSVKKAIGNCLESKEMRIHVKGCMERMLDEKLYPEECED